MSESHEEQAVNQAEDIFSRPSEFRQSTVLAVWEKAKPVKGKPDHRYDWRNGTVIGPWQPGESRDGVWDVGHIEPWYKVVERLKQTSGITRADVLDEFNDIDNLGVEDPETNRALGSNSRRRGVARLPYAEEEETLFENTHADEKEGLRQRFRSQIDEKSAAVKERVAQYATRRGGADEQPQRVIVWDTETTGLSPRRGDKLVEIAAVELVDGQPTGKQLHHYINPERPIPRRATKVHGISDEDVKDAPKFAEIAQEFLDFVGDAPLVAHNASFDMRFLNAELKAAGHEPIGRERKIDTLKLSRAVLPDLPKHDLDTIAEHFGVDTSGRDDHHGGLVDTLILSEVYQELAKLAKEQDVPILRTSAMQARMSPDAQEQEFAEAVEVERAFEQQWQQRHASQAQPKGFVDRLRDAVSPASSPQR